MATPFDLVSCFVKPERVAAGLPGTEQGTIVTVGTFDGVHCGHRDLLARLVDRAHAVGRPSLVVTFSPHPLEVVSPADAPHLLTVGDEKLDAIVDFGVDYVAVLPFTRILASYSADAFVTELLAHRLRMVELFIGYDHGLGRGRTGSVEYLRSLGERNGFPVHVAPAVTGPDGAPISSTSIRRAIGEGDLTRAAAALGTDYWFRGRVVPGSQRGRDLGFPTLNLELPSVRKLLPPEGVYAVRARTPRGSYGGMMNLGPRPTFGDATLALEVHLFDAAGDWYGVDVRVEFVSRLRDTVRFPSPAALVEQLNRDADAARRALTEL